MECNNIVSMDNTLGQVSVVNPKEDADEPPKQFTLDNVYDWDSTQRQVYDETAYPLVESVMEGYNGTIFAYGQTGTGKSHTMQGNAEPPEMRGIIPNSFVHIFEKIDADNAGVTYLVRASYLEIYNEEIRDLLGKDPKMKLDLKEKDTGVYVKDLTSYVVRSVKEIDQVMNIGQKNRSVGATLMNQESSRSHSIFTINVETSTEDPANPKKPKIRAGKLNLVDLAGSERQGKTGATGDRLKEATKINLSLSALGNCISALVDGRSSHIPYRDSKLTRLLQDSLGGNTKTVMFATVGPADYNYDETISTCRYANRAKNIKNKPKINEDPKDTMIREFQDEISRLKAQLEAQGGGGEVGDASWADEEQLIEDEIIEQTRVVEVMRGADEQKLLEMKGKNEEEKKLIREQLAADEKKREEIEAAITAKREELEAKQSERSELSNMMKVLEEKMLHGQEKTAQEREEADRLASELHRAKVEEENLRKEEERKQRQILEAQEEAEFVEDQFSSLKEEEEVKTKKLKKLVVKLKAAKTEKKDLMEEFQSEKDAMLETIRDLQRQINYSNVMIDMFVPPEGMDKIVENAMWDEFQSEWVINHVQHAGNNVPQAGEQDQNGQPQAGQIPNGGSYDPYAVADDPYAMQQQAENEQLAALANENITPQFFSYNPEKEGNLQEATRKASKARPSSGQGKRAKSARPGSGRPGSARSKKKETLESTTITGDVQKENVADDSPAVPKARGLVAKRPPSARMRTQIPK